MRESRVKKSILNAKVNLLFYFVMLILSFFSRKMFLTCLGTDFVGLTSTLQNLLGFLNLAELGIGSAIGFVLYKPLYDHDEIKINQIISVFGYLYRWIGFIILGGGLILGAFLPLIFAKSEMSDGIIFFAYFAFLTSSLIGYFANYKQTLLGADQKNYLVTAYFQTSNITKIIIQIASAYYTHNYYLWVVIELTFGIIYSIILNWKIRQVYPWLKSEISEGKQLLKKYPEVIKYTKQLFVHKIASFAQFQTTPFILYMYTSLQTVACYTNYTLIANQLFNFANKFLSSTEAGIGNLVAENNKNKIFSVFQELTSFRYFIAGIQSYGLYTLITPFITIWVGPEFVMSNTMLALVIASIFIMQTRGTNDQFINAHGLFWDVWAPIAETVLSLGGAIVLGYFYGLNGVLAGMLIGLLIIVCLWKPYFLFHYGLKRNVLIYWRIVLLNMIAIAIPFGITYWLLHTISLPPIDGYFLWAILAICNMSLYLILSIISFMSLTKGARMLFSRFYKKLCLKSR